MNVIDQVLFCALFDIAEVHPGMISIMNFTMGEEDNLGNKPGEFHLRPWGYGKSIVPPSCRHAMMGGGQTNSYQNK